jgi:tRNA nucleotidyltransferase (CCA-adding enzyme)
MYTKEADAYLVGKIAQCTWKEEWDRDLFHNAFGMNIFTKKLRALTHEILKSRASLSSIIESLTSHPFNFELLDCFFCYEI